GPVVSEGTVGFEDRLVVFVDCGNADRTPLGERLEEMTMSLNIDHHHDNTRFAKINLVDPAASASTELVWELSKALGAELTLALAGPLYVGLVTDTGRFGYENTTARSHEMAAELLRAGVDVSAVRRRLYEDVSPAKLNLLRLALDSMVIHGDGALIS